MDPASALLVNPAVSEWEADADLFNGLTFFRMHCPGEDQGFYYGWKKGGEGRPVAVAHFTGAGDGEYASPLRGSYGGFQWLNGDADIGEMEAFVRGVLADLVRRGGKRLRVVLPPLEYRSAELSLWTNILFRLGFLPGRVELNYSLPVDAAPFFEKINNSRRRIVRKLEKMGVTAQECGPEELPRIYALAAANKDRKQRRVSMTLEGLEEMERIFPGRMKFFGAFLDGVMIAGGLCLRVNSRVLYVFQWGEADEHYEHSPATLLAMKMYEHCAANGIALLDLGTSTLRSEPNASLMRFKSYLGASPGLKLELSATLEGA